MTLSRNNVQFSDLKDCEKAAKRRRILFIEILYEESRQINVIGLFQVHALNGALGKREKRGFIKAAIFFDETRPAPLECHVREKKKI